MFATTAVIMKQQTIEAEVTKYFPMKLLLDALAILPKGSRLKVPKFMMEQFKVEPN